jgi:hypothetical protein
MSEEQITEADVHRAARRADLAQAILDNPIYQEAFNFLKIQCFESFANVKTSDTESLVHIRLTMSVVMNLENFFKQTMSDADAAAEAFNAIINDKVV